MSQVNQWKAHLVHCHSQCCHSTQHQSLYLGFLQSLQWLFFLALAHSLRSQEHGRLQLQFHSHPSPYFVLLFLLPLFEAKLLPPILLLPSWSQQPSKDCIAFWLLHEGAPPSCLQYHVNLVIYWDCAILKFQFCIVHEELSPFCSAKCQKMKRPWLDE